MRYKSTVYLRDCINEWFGPANVQHRSGTALLPAANPVVKTQKGRKTRWVF
jgi:hypothetical protein